LLYLADQRWKKGIKPFALSVFFLGFVSCAVACFAYYPHVHPYIEPHWFSFSSIGFFLLVADYCLEWKKKMPARLWVLLVGVICSYWLVSLQVINVHWQNQESYCRYWLSVNQKNPTPFRGLAESLLKKGKHQEAFDALKRGITMNGNVDLVYMAHLGYAEFLSGRTPEARKHYDYVLNHSPQFSVIYHYLGQLYIYENRWQEAEQAYLRALQLYPQNKEYKSYLALIRKKTG
jgi:tetratricopeptide (TPR) repeat protein